MSQPAVTIDDWSEWTDDQILARHQCSGNQNTEIGVLHPGASEGGPPGWRIAPEVGLPSQCTALAIRFCPFCGDLLAVDE